MEKLHKVSIGCLISALHLAQTLTSADSKCNIPVKETADVSSDVISNEPASSSDVVDTKTINAVINRESSEAILIQEIANEHFREKNLLGRTVKNKG